MAETVQLFRVGIEDRDPRQIVDILLRHRVLRVYLAPEAEALADAITAAGIARLAGPTLDRGVIGVVGRPEPSDDAALEKAVQARSIPALDI